MSVINTRLYQLRELAIQQAFLALQGTPMQDRDGNVIMVDGKPLMAPPSAATLTAVLKLLKDNGIESDPIEIPEKPEAQIPFHVEEEPRLLE